MSEEITVTQTLTLPDILAGARWHHRRFSWKKWMQWPVAVAIVFAAYYLAKTSNGVKVDMFVFNISFVCVIILSFGASLIDRSLARKKLGKLIRELPSGQKVLHWKFQKEAVECASEGACSRTEWPVITESVSCPDGALIYRNKICFHWLPKTAFTSEADYNRFLDLLAAKTKHSKLG